MKRGNRWTEEEISWIPISLLDIPWRSLPQLTDDNISLRTIRSYSDITTCTSAPASQSVSFWFLPALYLNWWNLICISSIGDSLSLCQTNQFWKLKAKSLELTFPSRRDVVVSSGRHQLLSLSLLLREMSLKIIDDLTPRFCFLRSTAILHWRHVDPCPIIPSLFAPLNPLLSPFKEERHIFNIYFI